MTYVPQKGDLGFLDFNPQSGVEQDGNRPCIVLSPGEFNQATQLAVVCPVRSNSRGWPFEEKLPDGLKLKGYILTDQIRSVDWKARNFNKRDEAPPEVITACLEKIHAFL